MDIEDLSEVSVQLEDSDAEWEEGDDDVDEEQEDGDDEEEEEEAFLDTKGRISLLEKLKDRMSSSDLFDEDDEQAVTVEIERLIENERNSLQTKMKERLRILTRFDRLLDMGTHHPVLNEYFVRKQQEMNALA